MNIIPKTPSVTLALVIGSALLAGLIVLNHTISVSAYASDLDQAIVKYPDIETTRLEDCLLCHTSTNPTSGNPDLNPYGIDYDANSEDFDAIEGFNSDGDGYTNIEEINALTFPGNASDYPSVPLTPTLLLPPNNGTLTTTQAITFTWQAASGGGHPEGYNVQVNGGDVITTTGTASTTLLSAGVHTWTVRAHNAAGYSDWAPSWSVEIYHYQIYLPLVQCQSSN